MKEGEKLIEIKIIITDNLSTFESNVSDLSSRIFELIKHNGLHPKDVSVHEAEVVRDSGLRILVSGNGYGSTAKNFSSEEYPEDDVQAHKGVKDAKV